MPSSSGDAPRHEGQPTKRPAGSPLTKYFMVVLCVFSIVSLIVNNRFANKVHHSEDANAIASFLKDFHVNKKHEQILMRMAERFEKLDRESTAWESPEGGDNDDDNDNDNDDDEDIGEANDDIADGTDEGNEETNSVSEEQDDDDEVSGDVRKRKEENDGREPKSSKQGNTSHQFLEHTIANLNCEAHGGPSNKDAEEMVYWEDIPKDALHLSPFHAKHPDNEEDGGVQPITQYLTFEPDEGGWNNIRMAMETVFTLAFAMGRTLVLPPHQGMYLIDNSEKGQNNKFSFDHFFHTESISNEHIGLNIITTKDFLERCIRGEVVDVEGKPMYPPDMRTDWDGLKSKEIRKLTKWIRESSGQNLIHWDPDNCIAAFPASNSVQDTRDLESLPSQIDRLPGGFPPYEKYIGHPNPVDAPAIDRLREMNAGRHHLCTYTPELQHTQWLHFPVGMKTDNGDTSRLLVHFYAFLFFQDWKHDLWMKRFVRDHVRYIDEIQCAAARVVTAMRKRVSNRTKGNSTDFDTIHVRRGDFQFKETRVDAPKILKQLRRVLDEGTSLYIATDERDKSFFQPIVDHFADVVFLDDFLSEVEGVNTNYYGMIDQLVASRGKTFFGCWFSTFTGYINRLRGYHTDDHELPGFEQGIIPSYYYAMPDRFDHMQEFWPIKQQFYAREFPASWRLLDTAI
mmetsp:Transcript_14650/g.34054  ORF Transcript_14650/g.34054 Transcript_14650/m.34054 type:complete len:682 (+) Transcript_14650:88-2133(+)